MYTDICGFILDIIEEKRTKKLCVEKEKMLRLSLFLYIKNESIKINTHNMTQKVIYLC